MCAPSLRLHENIALFGYMNVWMSCSSELPRPSTAHLPSLDDADAWKTLCLGDASHPGMEPSAAFVQNLDQVGQQNRLKAFFLKAGRPVRNDVSVCRSLYGGYCGGSPSGLQRMIKASAHWPHSGYIHWQL